MHGIKIEAMQARNQSARDRHAGVLSGQSPSASGHRDACLLAALCAPRKALACALPLPPPALEVGGLHVRQGFVVPNGRPAGRVKARTESEQGPRRRCRLHLCCRRAGWHRRRHGGRATGLGCKWCRVTACAARVAAVDRRRVLMGWGTGRGGSWRGRVTDSAGPCLPPVIALVSCPRSRGLPGRSAARGRLRRRPCRLAAARAGRRRRPRPAPSPA